MSPPCQREKLLFISNYQLSSKTSNSSVWSRGWREINIWSVRVSKDFNWIDHAQGLNDVSSGLFGSSGCEIKQWYLQGFPVESASQQRLGVCNGTDEGTPLPPGAQSTQDEDLWYKHVLVGVLVVFVVVVLAVLLIWYCRRRRPKPSNEKRTFKKRKPIVLGPEIELKPIPGKPLVLPDDDPSLPPSYISETSLNKPVYSDDEDEVDYGKRSPSVVYEPPPPFHATLADDPRNSPPPAYFMPPMY